MSRDWVKDISEMHSKFKVNETVNSLSPSMMKELLDFRMKMIREELEESETAISNSDPEEVVDGIIDLIVFAIGTLNAFNVDPYIAWDRVLRKNMEKEPGVKEGRPNPFGFPDLIKPEGWKPPEHTDNHGLLNLILKGG